MSNCVMLWTVAHQAPLSMEFSRQEHWSGLPCPPPGNFPDPGIKLTSLMSPALAGGFFTTSATWEAPIKVLVPFNLTYKTLYGMIVRANSYCVVSSSQCHWFLYAFVCVWQSLSCVQLCDPMGCSPPGSSLQGILQARILEWAAIFFSRGSS